MQDGVARCYLLLAFCVVAFSCADPPATQEAVSPDGAVTFYEQVQPILKASCNGCHRSGGIAPFSLASYEDVVGLGAVIADSVETGRMPPWPPEEGCGDFLGARVLQPGEKETISAWVDGGMAEGNSSAGAPSPEPESEEGADSPKLILGSAEGYIPNRELPDDYRCIILDHEFAQEAFITGVTVLPDKEEIVHHVLLYLVRQGDLAALEALDEADDGEGYTCFGGPGVGSGATLGGWAPGGAPTYRRDEAAIVVPKGSKLVMQVHYNVLALDEGAELPRDRTQVGLWLMEEGEVPEYEVLIHPLANGNIEISAHDGGSEHILDYPITTETKIVGVTPHMHLLGKSIKVELIRDGEEDQCMVHIPEWDFSWQQFYTYAEEAWIVAEKGDKIRLTCVYDNSQENQPVVNGALQEPRDVLWGDGSLDEMCLNYITVLRPYNAGLADQPQCVGYDFCADLCPEDDGLCFFSCGLAQGVDCLECTMPAVIGCGFATCEADTTSLYTCLQGCGDLGASPECMMHSCIEEYSAFYGCLRPHILEGTCDEKLEKCGVSPLEEEQRL